MPRLMRSTGTSRWYFVGDDYCWPRTTSACARQIVEKAGGSVVAERFVPLGTRDFAPLLEEIERSKAELILSTFVGADEAAFERQFHAAGLRAQCQTLAPALDEATREHIGTLAGDGIWTVFGYFEQLPTAANKAFLQRYRQRFGACSPPLSSFSEGAYEAFHLVTRAAWRARSWEPSEVGRMLACSSFDGPRGHIAVTDPEHLAQTLYLAETVPGGFAVREAIG
jgi:branched-chain amino acid transport system substrate-binding protein